MPPPTDDELLREFAMFILARREFENAERAFLTGPWSKATDTQRDQTRLRAKELSDASGS